MIPPEIDPAFSLFGYIMLYQLAKKALNMSKIVENLSVKNHHVTSDQPEFTGPKNQECVPWKTTQFMKWSFERSNV